MVWRARARSDGGLRRPLRSNLARTARSSGLSRSIALQVDGQLARWGERLVNSAGGSEEADWRRGLGALLTDSAALSQALARQEPAARRAAGNADRLDVMHCPHQRAERFGATEPFDLGFRGHLVDCDLRHPASAHRQAKRGACRVPWRWCGQWRVARPSGRRCGPSRLPLPMRATACG